MKKKLDNFEKDSFKVRSKNVYVNEFIEVVKNGYGYNFSLSLNEQRLLYFIYAHNQVEKCDNFSLGNYVTKLRDYNLNSNEIYRNIENRINLFKELQMNFDGEIFNVFDNIIFRDNKIQYHINEEFSSRIFPPLDNKGKSFKAIPYEILMLSKSKYELNAYRILSQVSGHKKYIQNTKTIYPNNYYSVFGLSSKIYPYQVKNIIRKINNSEVLKLYFEFDMELNDKNHLIISRCDFISKKTPEKETFTISEKRRLAEYFVEIPYDQVKSNGFIRKKVIVSDFWNLIDCIEEEIHLSKIYSLFVGNYESNQLVHPSKIKVKKLKKDMELFRYEKAIDLFQNKLIENLEKIKVEEFNRNEEDLPF